jgi:hypothetical protein
MAREEILRGIYTGAALNTPASNVLRIPSITGTITGVFLDTTEASDGDTEFELFEDGVSVTTITVADTTANENVTGLSFSSTLGKNLSLSLIAPIPAGVPAPPWSLHVTVEVTETHVALTGNQTVAGVKTFSSDPIIPDEAYGVGWNGSLEPPTKNAVYDKIETVSAGGVSDGDKGDIVVSSSGTVWSIDAGVIVNADINASAAIDISKLGTSTSQALGVGSIELGHASDTTIARASAGNITVEGNAIYRAGGTDVPLADGGTGASLADPGADRVMFWDDSAGAVTWLTMGTNLTITGTTLDATGGGGGGSGTFSIDDGTAAASGTFTFDDGTAA